MDKGDDWGTHNIERAARETVSYFSMRIGIQLIRSTVGNDYLVIYDSS